MKNIEILVVITTVFMVFYLGFVLGEYKQRKITGEVYSTVCSNIIMSLDCDMSKLELK